MVSVHGPPHTQDFNGFMRPRVVSGTRGSAGGSGEAPGQGGRQLPPSGGCSLPDLPGSHSPL